MADPRTVSAKIFLSYRRQDSSGHTGRVFDRLNAAFGADAVFHDVDSIRAGQDFVQAIEESVGGCSTALVMIGPDWLRMEGAAGERRLEDANDFVRLEVASVLRRGIPVIPVLVGGAQMPAAADLPEELRPLARCNAIELRHSHFEGDIRKLVGVLEEITSLRAKSPSVLADMVRRMCESPVYVAQATVCVATAVLSYLWPPPADLTADGSRAAAPVAVIVLFAAAILLAILQTKPAASGPRRLMVVAMACLACGIGAVLVGQSLLSDFTTVYDSRTVGVGSELMPMAREYLEAHPEMTLQQLVMDAGGEVAGLWTRDSIRHNVLMLRAAHVALMVSFAGCVLAFLQLIRRKR